MLKTCCKQKCYKREKSKHKKKKKKKKMLQEWLRPVANENFNKNG